MVLEDIAKSFSLIEGRSKKGGGVSTSLGDIPKKHLLRPSLMRELQSLSAVALAEEGIPHQCVKHVFVFVFFCVSYKNSNLCVSLCYCVSCSSSILVCVNCKFLFLQWSFRLAHKNPICLRHLDFVFPTLGSSTLHNGELNHFKYWQIQISKYSKIFKYWQMFAKFVLCCIFCFFAGAKPSSMN